MKWVSSVTPRILGVLFNGVTTSVIHTWGWSRNWWVSEVNGVMQDFWGAMASCLPSAHLTSREQSWFALASASTMLEAEASNVKSSAYDFMSASGMGQSETKWLKRAGEMTEPCGTPARTWGQGE